MQYITKIILSYFSFLFTALVKYSFRNNSQNMGSVFDRSTNRSKKTEKAELEQWAVRLKKIEENSGKVQKGGLKNKNK